MLTTLQGLRTITPMPSAEEVIKEMLLYLLDPKDTDRAFVKFDSNDDVAMLINNFGGLSNLELETLTSIVRTQLRACPFETLLITKLMQLRRN